MRVFATTPRLSFIVDRQTTDAQRPKLHTMKMVGKEGITALPSLSLAKRFLHDCKDPALTLFSPPSPAELVEFLEDQQTKGIRFVALDFGATIRFRPIQRIIERAKEIAI